PPGPLVLGGQPWEAGAVLDASPAAGRLGVRRGQPLGSAHKLIPEATFLRPDPPAYRAAVEVALEALGDFTPAVEGETDPEAPAFGRILLGVEGLTRLWGDEMTLLRRVEERLASLLPGPPRAGFGNTRFGAAVGAAVGGDVPPGPAGVEAAFLAPLPIRLLPADEVTQARFRLFGLACLGDLARLPRSAVVARFGLAGGELHDLARGLDRRPLVPRRPVERLRAAAELEPPVETLEPLRFVLHRLAGALCEQLAARGAGAARASLELTLDHAPALRLVQALPEPVAVGELVERLLVARLETQPPGAPVTRLILELDGQAPAAATQLGLFVPQSARADRLAWQLAALAIRFGPDRLWQATLRDPEARLAEERTAWVPATEARAGEGQRSP
ncbi:MAG: DNA polymerase Y family protein, partial [Candidatus Limnocylindrales bacterium]